MLKAKILEVLNKRIIVGIDNKLVPQKIFAELFSHGPLERQELQLHGAVVNHVNRGPKTAAGIRNGSYSPTLLLGEDCPKPP